MALLGPNGCGKSSVVDMITGDSPLAFGQAVTLFGRRKGSGESVWDIKRKIGHVTPRSHMQYLTFCDPHNAADAVGRSGKTVSSRDVVMSGFYDTIGLYDRPAAEHGDIADAWVATLGIGDLVSATPGSFTRLSLGQQKLVLLCRALVKRPRLLVLDEPTHALSRSSGRFLTALRRPDARTWPCWPTARTKLKPELRRRLARGAATATAATACRASLSSSTPSDDDAAANEVDPPENGGRLNETCCARLEGGDDLQTKCKRDSPVVRPHRVCGRTRPPRPFYQPVAVSIEPGPW